MRAIVGQWMGRVAVVGIAATAIACGGGRSEDELSRDLALAASDGLEMAPAAALQTVSPIEANVPKPEKTPRIERAARAGAARPKRRVVEPTPEPTPEATEVAMEPSPEPTVVAEAPEPTTTAPTPAPVPRPAPIPVSLPTGDDDGGWGRRGDGGGIGGVLGGIGGVIIRGGSIGDDDHCEIHRTGRGRGGILINDRLPSGTFPRRPGGGFRRVSSKLARP